MWCPCSPSTAWCKLLGSLELLPFALPWGLALTLSDPWAPSRLGALPSGARHTCPGRMQAPCTHPDPLPKLTPHPPLQPPPHHHFPPRLSVAKVLYLLGVAMATLAGVSCRHPHAGCFLLPGRTRAGVPSFLGCVSQPSMVFQRFPSFFGRQEAATSPLHPGVMPAALPPPHEHNRKEKVRGWGLTHL